MEKVTEGGGAPDPKNEPVETAKVYDDAFDEAEKAGGSAELSPADDPANVPAGDPPAETPPVEAPPAPPATPPETPATPPDTEQQPGETDEAYKQRWLSLQGIHKHDKETWETEKAELLAQLETARKETPEPPAPTAEKPPQTPEEIAAAADAIYAGLTDEQKAALKDYRQDFDTISSMEAMLRAEELKKLREEIDGKLASLDARIAPVIKRTEETETDAHFEAIQEAHADYEKYIEDGSLMAWIEKQPSYLQPALKQVYEKGTAEDAIDMISTFKRENNIPLTPPVNPENVVPINQKREQKRKALAAVDTRRSAVAVQQPIKDDYEGAFDEAAGKQG